ncbi:MAG TPA: 4-alpha-glucanotransferase, partial [Spirochaetia bacterium]|nr:4-alpha-glucanotransferase [Spirochaetia bacterium]
KQRRPAALITARRELSRAIGRHLFLQYLFFTQWETLHRYAEARGVRIAGDLPIYVDYHSADVWTNPSLFKLDRRGRMTKVSGVPPDYFSNTGQRWGNPVYDWERCRETGYAWWKARIQHTLSLVDVVRIDHFRAFSQYWEIDAAEKTAVHGRWVDGPGRDLFRALRVSNAGKRIWAEDLGVITPDVRRLLKKLQLPGMRVLLFGFSGNVRTNYHQPRNYVTHCVAYTGNHDTNTVKGWYRKETDRTIRNNLKKVLGGRVTARNINDLLMELLAASKARVVIYPLQDVLGLDEKARMNIPGTEKGNWEWRAPLTYTDDAVRAALADLTRRHRRGLSAPAD